MPRQEEDHKRKIWGNFEFTGKYSMLNSLCYWLGTSHGGQSSDCPMQVLHWVVDVAACDECKKVIKEHHTRMISLRCVTCAACTPLKTRTHLFTRNWKSWKPSLWSRAWVSHIFWHFCFLQKFIESIIFTHTFMNTYISCEKKTRRNCVMVTILVVLHICT